MTPVRKRILIAAAAVLGLIIAGYFFSALSFGHTARPGTTVQGVDIAGLTEPEAAQRVEEELAPLAAKKLRVKALDDTFVIKPTDAGLAVDGAASVAPAFGRTWNPIALISTWFGAPSLDAVVDVDEAALTAQIDTVAQTVDNPPVEPVVAVKKGEVKVTPGKPGTVLDQQALAADLTEAFLRPRSPLTASIIDADPAVTAEDAAAAASLATTAMGAPVTVQADTITATIPGEAVGRALAFSVQDGRIVPELDGSVLHRSIADQLKPIETPGRDATFKIRGGQPKVVKSKVGKGVADDELATAVSAVIANPPDDRSVTVSVGVREPRLTTEQAQQLGITEKLSSFTQNFPYAAYRKQNIGQAARRINGTLLLPGETFSLNDTIKERTEKNGYTIGFVVGEGGVFDEQLGGGVSTAATTTWTAAFFAGLERVQNIAHSIYISRYQAGLEATVAWGIFDMKFRNDTPDGVFITSSATGTSITVSMWGTKQYDEVDAEFGERKDIVPFATVYDTSDTCLGQGGVDGFTITVDRVFYKDGEEVKREPITTRYKPAPEVLCHKKPKKDKNPGKAAGGSADAGASPSASDSPSGAKPSASKGSGSGTGAGTDTFSNDPTPSPTPTKKS